MIKRYNSYNKYKNQKVTVDGVEFDSKKEARRYCELRLLCKAGEISNLCLQVKYELIPKQDGERAVYYLADFVYRDNDGNEVVEDAKGMRTDVYRIKKKLMLWVHGIRIKEV